MAAEENKSVLYETLKKITYDNLNQFVEDLNRNFAVIQNSPLYKGIPGLPGDEGDPGLRGLRGSRYFFVNVNKFNEQFPGEILNGTVITLAWLNSKLQNFVEKNKLLTALGADTFVDTDIIVLTNSIMVQYIMLEDILKDTGIAFNQQSNLISSIETKIEKYVKYYVDNHPSILSLQNIFEHYITYAKNYASTNNAYITNAQTKSSVYMPYFAGVTDTQGIRLDNHKYFGFADKEFPESNKGTIVFGSMKRYCRLMLQTLSVTTEKTYTSDYAPGENNLPAAIFLQDTDNAGLMFGRKMSANLRRFGMIFKDKDDNLVIKSDMGNLLTDYSSIILNKMFLKYSKEVWFDDNLNLGKDFLHKGNTSNKFYRTAEYIWDAKKYGPTSLAEGTQDQLTIAAEKRRKIMEVGYFMHGDDKPGAGAEYRNHNETIILPWFVNNVLVTDADGNVLKTYFVEISDISVADAAISSDNLDDLLWSGTTPDTNAIVTSNYIETVIKKINAIQQYSKINYWRKDQFAPVIGNKAPIPSLNLSKDLYVNELAVFGPAENLDARYFIPNLVDKTLTLGSIEAGSKLILRSKDIQFSNWTTADIVLTTDSSGNLLKTFFREKISITDKSIASIAASQEFDNSNNYITSNYYQWLIDRLNDSNNDLRDNYWRKEDYSPSGISKIPALWLTKNLKCRHIVSQNLMTTDTTTTINNKDILLGDVNATDGRISLLSNEIYISKLSPNSFLALDGNKLVKTQFTKEVFPLPVVNGLEQITLGIISPETHVLTSEYLLWLNNRMNKIVGMENSDSGLLGLFWKKSEFTGFKIPDLELSGVLSARGDIKFGPNHNPYIVTTNANKTIELGQLGEESSVVLNSDKILLKDDDFKVKVLVTDTSGYIRKDITMCVDTNETQASDNLVPLDTDDNVGNGDSGVIKTKNWKHIITGQQMNWVHGFMNAVKKRFLNTFNRKESIDQMYKHFPVGGIIIWTYASSSAAGIEGQIPEGFCVCDGSIIPNTTVATPNLVDLFVRGVGSIGVAAGVSGADEVRLVGANIPAHKHSVKTENATVPEHTEMKGTFKPGNKADGTYTALGATDSTSRDGLWQIGNDVYSSYQIQIGRLGAVHSNAEGDTSSDNEFWLTNNTGQFNLQKFLDMTFQCLGLTGATHLEHKHSVTEEEYGKTVPDTFNVVPKYYKVLYLMKYNTRVKGGVGFNNKYELVP